MARIIVVTSGKGGVGKTTTSAAISMGLAKKGHKTVVIDFDANQQAFYPFQKQVLLHPNGELKYLLP